MGTNRRNFITTAFAGSMAAALPLSACRSASQALYPDESYARLDEILEIACFETGTFYIPGNNRND